MTTKPIRIQDAAKAWGVPEDELARFVQRQRKSLHRQGIAKLCAGMPPKVAVCILAVHRLRKAGVEHPTRVQVEDEMRSMGYRSPSGRVDVSSITSNWHNTLLARPEGRTGDDVAYAHLSREKRSVRFRITPEGTAWATTTDAELMEAIKKGLYSEE